jgi:phage-related minor tail protein
MTDDDTARLDASLEATRDRLSDIDALTARVGRTIATTFARGVADGRRFEDVLRQLGARLADLALKAAFKPLEQGFGQLVSGALSAVSGGTGAGSPLPITPFADGGVIATPAYFPLGRGLGLAGEAGPEAILPLARGSDGRLGVRAGAGAGAVNLTVNIATPDVEGFRRSSGEVAAALARAVARGQRGL